MNYKKAEKLTTQKEFSLIERAQMDLSLKALKSLISRARKLRNKYVDLSRRQTIKKKTGSGTPKRTADKTKLFENVLDKLEKKLKTKEKATKKTAKPRLGTEKLKSSKEDAVNRSSNEETFAHEVTQPENFSKKTQVKRKAKRIARASSKRIAGHISSRNKRDQKNRDVKNG
ncbi:hypothetical protein GW915_12330 [bacterium]|nr:hypothetical protein [bacterium]